MGFLDFLTGKEASTRGAYSLRCELHPYSLKHNTNDYLDLEIDLENASGEPALTSVTVAVPKGLGFDRSAISQTKELRLGELAAGERKHLKVQVWSTQRTEKGDYPLAITVTSHERDYSHVLNYVRKRLELRVD